MAPSTPAPSSPEPKPSKATSLLEIAGLALYLDAYWKVFRTHPGNKVVRCGVIAITVFAALLVLTQFPSVPQRLIDYVGLLLPFLCLFTLGFLFQRMYRAVRRMLRKST